MNSSARFCILSVSALMLVAIATGCGGGQRVAHRTSLPEAGVTHRTYAVLVHPVNEGELDEIVANTMHDIMAARGYVRTEASNADMLVSFGVLLTDPRVGADGRMETSDLSTQPDAPVRTKTLVVMLHDGDTREVVWIGISTTSAADSDLREHTAEILRDIEARIPAAGT